VNASVPPAEAYEIQVIAHKWGWNFTYPNGVSSSELVIPVNRPVRMIMSSQDVIHSFYVPEFRVKRDVIPGIFTTVWFEANEVGDTTLECAEYCGGNGDGSIGTGHSGMLAAVHILSGGDFDAWLKKKEEEDNTLSPADLGKKLFAEKQCNGCHSLEAGKVITGPSFKGLFMRQETMQDGLVVTADENYLRESILQSQAKIVKGFPSVMPVFQGQLSEKQVNGLIAFIKEQK
jgi:cytochrome c oxidase subunit 2